MELQTLTYIVVGATFALYIAIAFLSRASSTGEFYVAGKGINPVANGMATAADWMSAASFISMAGLIAFLGYDASVYLMGWTGGYVLLALLLAPYLRKFGKFTVPEFIGDRYYSKAARLVAVICLIVASITYVIGQMKGVGVAFGRFPRSALRDRCPGWHGHRFHIRRYGWHERDHLHTDRPVLCVDFCLHGPGDLHCAEPDRQSDPATRTGQLNGGWIRCFICWTSWTRW